MKLICLSWDFVFGMLLIGGAPLCVVALTVILGDIYESKQWFYMDRGFALAQIIDAIFASYHSITFRSCINIPVKV